LLKEIPPKQTVVAVGEAAPVIASATAFLAGAATIISAANPSSTSRAVDTLSLITREAPSILAAIAGVALMALADGLRRRVDASLWSAAALSSGAAAYFVLHHERYLDAALQSAFVIFLIVNRHAFYRRARAFSPKRLQRGWYLLSIAILLAALVGAVLWASTQASFRAAPWWSLLVDPIIGRAGRPVAAAAVALSGLVIWRYLATQHVPAPPPPGPEDLQHADAVFAKADDPPPEANLVYQGDLALYFNDSRTSFVPYAQTAGSMIALCGPVGPVSERRAALAGFCEAAAQKGLRPVVYAAPPTLLPDLLDLGFKIEKIGENAVISLSAFSLAGKARESIRYANRKLTQREGARFAMHLPPHPEALFTTLRPISDAWLAFHKSTEKRFSLGRFDRGLLDHCPIAVASIAERPAAFGSILTSPDRKRAALDLMRYDPGSAPPGTMDFLLSEMILWAKDAGFEQFDLSMAPLSGLAEERFAPLFARLGRLVYEQGGRWYNFEGLRRFKEKFAPQWTPRYLAARGPFSAPIALAEIALLTNSPPGD